MNILRPSLAGKTCLVAGATGGIGFAVARRFAAEGARVVLVGRAGSERSAAAKLLELRAWERGAAAVGKSEQNRREQYKNKKGEEEEEEEEESRHEAIETDILQPEGWAQILKQCQTVDVLVNCAGTSQASLLVKTPPARIDEILSTNLRAAILGCQAVGRHMIRARTRGCIVNVSSLLAARGKIGTSVYAASKAGLLGLTSSLAVEYGAFGIRVNAVVPGYIDTRMIEGLNTQQLLDAIPLKRFGTAAEVADAAAFLARNEYANNCILNLDGGLSAV